MDMGACLGFSMIKCACGLLVLLAALCITLHLQAFRDDCTPHVQGSAQRSCCCSLVCWVGGGKVNLEVLIAVGSQCSNEVSTTYALRRCGHNFQCSNGLGFLKAARGCHVGVALCAVLLETYNSLHCRTKSAAVGCACFLSQCSNQTLTMLCPHWVGRCCSVPFLQPALQLVCTT